MASSRVILVVEDSPDTATTTAMLIKAMGCQAVIAADGESALESLWREPIGLVLLDLGLPGIDGYEVARRIRAEPAHAHLPIVCLSAHGFPEHRSRALEAGCNIHLTKPVEYEVLRETILEFLDQ